MAYFSGLMFLVVVVMVALSGGASAQTTHVVLDSTGWTIPQAGGASAYTTWAASKAFMVGDTLVFNFANGRHDVAQVNKAAFDACTTTNTIGPLLTASPANITLNMAGEHFYICTFGEHCTLGQKLAINVTGSPSTAAPPTTLAPNGGPTVASPPTSVPPTGGPTVSSPPSPTSVPPTGSPPVLTPPVSTGPAPAVPNNPNSASGAASAYMFACASLSVILLSLVATCIL